MRGINTWYAAALPWFYVGMAFGVIGCGVIMNNDQLDKLSSDEDMTDSDDDEPMCSHAQFLHDAARESLDAYNACVRWKENLAALRNRLSQHAVIEHAQQHQYRGVTAATGDAQNSQNHDRGADFSMSPLRAALMPDTEADRQFANRVSGVDVAVMPSSADKMDSSSLSQDDHSGAVMAISPPASVNRVNQQQGSDRFSLFAHVRAYSPDFATCMTPKSVACSSRMDSSDCCAGDGLCICTAMQVETPPAKQPSSTSGLSVFASAMASRPAMTPAQITALRAEVAWLSDRERAINTRMCELKNTLGFISGLADQFGVLNLPSLLAYSQPQGDTVTFMQVLNQHMAGRPRARTEGRLPRTSSFLRGLYNENKVSVAQLTRSRQRVKRYSFDGGAGFRPYASFEAFQACIDEGLSKDLDLKKAPLASINEQDMRP